MARLQEGFQDTQHYILEKQVPVICDDETTWRAFMRNGENLLVAKDAVGKYTVITVFLGFNHGEIETPQFFQTTCFGASSETRSKYSATWERACLRHRGTVACAESLTKFAADQAAGVDKSFEFVDCNVVPGELQFILQSEAEAIEFMPTNRENWERRGRVIVFLL
ncbi:hypothetical protein IQ260_26350 [Leptolyngbya cf. ectocarpi LEGE 11479]|uniref:Uncharacterized protein n=1 Tax=Leptolyngbya cf. ectocarpi LEGE 11479 TaxID=1828722 RepID=A0A928ZZ87_LEPEC|nr:hypothetical protein [Leptolyngbya ectocarpi]MBE9070167.1 hypothetical protein [Leptolyngbya cf. ectocarpi LEGE 11479]